MIPNSAKKKLLSAGIDLVNDTIKVMLLTSTHTSNADTQEFLSDVNTNEVTGTGYSTGGITLANKTVTQDNTGDLGKFDADDVSWTTSTITARYAVIYKSTGVASTSPIISIIDFGSNQTTSAGTFLIQWNASGILTIG
jgi:hypothetical protein